MAQHYITHPSDQVFLLPIDMNEWIPEDDLSNIVLDLVDHKFDLSRFYGKHREGGLGAVFFDPKIKVGLIQYSYCQGVRSSRQIERNCYRDVAYWIVERNHQPDHTTISRICKSFTSELEILFFQFLKILHKNGMVNVGVIALDGTKMKANAAMRRNRTITQMEIQIKQMFEDSRRIEEEENGNSNGKKLRGRKPKPPVPDSQRATKINTTDPDSRIMKSYHNDYFQGFNAQIVVSQNQYIIAADVMNDENDSNLLIPMVKHLEELECYPVSDSVLLTNAGYRGYSLSGNV